MNKSSYSLVILFFTLNIISEVTSTSLNNGQLILEDIPVIPQRISDDISRYQNIRSGSFQNFNEDGTEMYISTRFGNVSQLHKVKKPGGARFQLTYFEEPIGSINRQPDGEVIAFTMDAKGNENAQVFILNPKNGEYKMLTDGISRNGSPVWSEDGEKIAYRSNKRNGASNDVWITSVDDKNKSEMILESQDGTSWGAIDWSNDNKKILIQNYISVSNSKIYSIDVESKTKSLIIGSNDKKSVNIGLNFDNDDKGIFFITNEFSDYRNLAYKNIQTGQVTLITNDIRWNVDSFVLSKDGSRAAFSINENGFSSLYLMETSSYKFNKVKNIPIGLVSGIEFNRQSTSLGLSINTYQSPSDAYTLELKKDPLEYGDLVKWTESEIGGLDTTKFVKPKFFSYETFDGLNIPAFIYKKKSEKPLPVIIYIHGGPESQSRPRFSSTFQQWIDKLGVAVITPNVRGSNGYGKNFLELDNGFKREDSVKDIGSLINWIEKQPDLDASKIAVYGGSYGGYMVLASAVFYSDKLKAAVDVVGISNFVTFLKNTKDYRRDLRRVEYGDERDPKMRDFLEEISPNNNVEKIKVPMFVIQGQNDPRVPVTEAEQIVDALRNSNKQVWYMNALNEGHGYRKKENRDIYQQAVILFFEKYLISSDQ
ncbi:MAG: TetR family transcriptional regulator [Gammaproteobacteria bacterium TMED278]|nr:TetR family transcriptional regulator [Gammaproteobacteria bacterium]OUX42439.1 MAG: TetR family transcriptional regulator [Gammaproteobacteria bacterium TMED278]|tara:strand:+ start:141 stop:2096 length:1956 start_codon:yes stop_codon:yes gene_type:complete